MRVERTPLRLGRARASARLSGRPREAGARRGSSASSRDGGGTMDQAFHDAMAHGYALGGPSLVLGSPMRGGGIVKDLPVPVALSMMNRPGPRAGGAGTGQTKT